MGARESKLAEKGFSHLVEVYFKKISLSVSHMMLLTETRMLYGALILDSLSGTKSQHLLS